MTKEMMIRRLLERYEDGILEIQYKHDKRLIHLKSEGHGSWDDPVVLGENMRYCEELNKLQNEILAEIIEIAGEGSEDV